MTARRSHLVRPASLSVLTLLALVAGGGCSAGGPPTAPPEDAAIAVSLSSDNAPDLFAVEVVFSLVAAVPASGSDVSLGNPGTVELIALADEAGDLVEGEVDAGTFTGLEVTFANSGHVVIEVEGGFPAPLTINPVTVSIPDDFTVQDGATTRLELSIDLGQLEQTPGGEWVLFPDLTLVSGAG
jgi:hypothetical protein